MEQTLLWNTIPHSIEQEITQSYIDYAMSVIVSRALPDVRDGFKPVLRRILYAMHDMGLSHNAKYKKSASVVWEVLWKYHPHGDSSVYEAMVRMAQPFSMRYPLVDGQGNFWSIDGDGAAAMRYTEARLTRIAEEMLEDIDQDTVDRRPNYDQSREEPIMLPTKFPNHLCNGTMGIAVGMATNMASHNLTEIIDACLLLIENPEATIDDIMEIVKWPDFATGGIIFDPTTIKAVYEKGRWWITCRGKTHIEELKGQKIIVIDEIPYQVNKSTLCSKIGELVMEKKIEGIVDMRDESSKNIIRVTITLRKGIDPNDVLTQLYKFTELQTNFNINNVSLIEKASQPRVMNIKELLMEFVTFRREVIYKRSVFQLNKAKDRLHILEWLKKAIDILDDVIATIRNANTKQEAKEALMNNFEFSDEQAEYILQMRLQSLVGLEFQKVLDEIEEKKKQIEYLEGIINNPKKLDEVVIDEMVYVKDEYGDARRTEVSTDTSVYELTGSIKALRKAQDQIKEDVILWIGNDHTVRVLYQSRINIIPEDSLEVVYTHNQDKLIALTDTGELVIERLKDLWSFQMKQKSLDIKEKYGLKGNIIFVSSMLHDYQYLGFLSNDNSIKKIKKELLLSFRKFPTVCMSLKEWEKLIKVEAVREWDKIWVVSEQWLLTLFPESGIRPMWKTAWWVKAIELPADDKVANFFVYKDEPFIMIYWTKAGKLINKEDLIFWKSEFAKRGGKTLLVADIEWKEIIKGAISIVEWSVRIRLSDGQIVNVHSNDIQLDDLETPMVGITKEPIDIVYRPREEKEENQKYKLERKEEKKKEEAEENAE